MVPKTECSVSALEAVVGSRMVIINLIALVLGQCLTQSCSMFADRKDFLHPGLLTLENKVSWETQCILHEWF